MPVFVNLPLSYAAQHPAYVDMFLARNICPELGMDTVAVQELSEAWHRALAKRFADAGLTCAVHLPFFDLSPGSMNDAVLDASRRTLRRGAELATLYAPHHMVGHPTFNRGEHEPRFEEWLRRSAQTWAGVLEAGRAPLYLENTYERSAGSIVQLLERLGTGSQRAGFCLDVGHWHAFGGGSRRNTLSEWLGSIGRHLGHLHLHDNDGTEDSHAGLGAGSIPLDDLLMGIRELTDRWDIRPSATLEPHTVEAFETSMAYLAHRPEWSRALGEMA